MTATVGGAVATRVRLRRSRFGRATLEAAFVPDEPLDPLEGGAVALDLGGARVFTGASYRGGLDGGVARVRAREAPGLERRLPPRFYDLTDARLVARDALREAGEAGEVALSAALPAFVRVAGTAAALLSRLCERERAVWRTRPDGTVYAGPEPDAPEVALAWGDEAIGRRPEDGAFELLLRPALLPGARVRVDAPGGVAAGRVDALEHTLERGEARTWIWIA